MNLFDGLYAYEVVLLILGVLLFVVALALLILQVVRGKPYGTLVAFFALPIVMIGYPSIQKITFQDGAVTIDKTTAQLQEAPTDAALRSNLETQVAKLASRPTNDPAALTSIAKAQFALGHSAEAQTNVQKALQASPTLPEALALQQRIDTDNTITNLSAQLAEHPNDATKEKLKDAVAKAAPLKIANPGFLAHMAIAHAALGDQAIAHSFAGEALKINPNLAEAKLLKSLAESPGAHP